MFTKVIFTNDVMECVELGTFNALCNFTAAIYGVHATVRA